MQYHHLYADADGQSHWREVAVALEVTRFAPPAEDIELGTPFPVRQAAFLRLAAGWDEPVHPSPAAQMLVCLSGAVIVTASDGEVRRIGAGDVWLMEDTHGAGHHTRVDGDAPFEALVVQTA